MHYQLTFATSGDQIHPGDTELTLIIMVQNSFILIIQSDQIILFEMIIYNIHSRFQQKEPVLLCLEGYIAITQQLFSVKVEQILFIKLFY
jgi:hypothetical protein